MAFAPTKIPYSQTGFFSKIVIDYLNNDVSLRPFFAHEVSVGGLESAIKARQNFNTNRTGLAVALANQYKNIQTTPAVLQNIELLKKESTFTITTAHQPNIFTGPLYFLYKILHAVKLAEYSKQQFPQYDFVPIYYMGSEDADLDELGHFYINGQKKIWNTNQSGAVGRMVVDQALLKLIDEVSGEINVQPFGTEIISTLKDFYKEGITIQDATFGLVDRLFNKFGVIVVIPDSPELKGLATNIFEKELLEGNSSKITEETGVQLKAAGYEPQAHSREINFFYLKDDQRERIEKENVVWKVVGSDIFFTKEQILQELQQHPERFSPNVILRGIFQEIILPNIAFIGGGGELAYWLQLKNLFEFYKVPYPMLVLRNSFLMADEKSVQQKNKLGFSLEDIFLPTQKLQNNWATKNTKNNLSVNQPLQEIEKAYQQLSKQAESIDSTLLQHIEALKKNTTKRIEILGKKMLRAEKRNHHDAMRQIEKLKQKLFPNNNLQERIDNFIPYYAKFGSEFINELYKNSLSLEQEFVVLEET